MRGLFCRFFGHAWNIPSGFRLTEPIYCGRCGFDMDYMGQARRNHPELFDGS